MFNEIFI